MSAVRTIGPEKKASWRQALGAISRQPGLEANGACMQAWSKTSRSSIKQVCSRANVAHYRQFALKAR